MIRISNVAQSIEPSLTRKLFNMAKSYSDVIDFTLGDPDIITHENIRNAGCEAIMQGRTRYSQNAGLLELRKVISDYVESYEGLKYDYDEEIIVTVGGMEGLYLAFLSLLNPNDEVIIPAPYYVNYKQMVQMCGAVPMIAEPDENLSLSIENIKNKISTKTKLIVLNSPCNPSGQIVSNEILHQLADIVIENDLILITDEVYKTLIYDNKKFDSIAKFEKMHNHCIIVNSLSKQFSMTGWRLGYVLAPEPIITTMTKLQENVVACAPLPSQYAAIEALKHPQEYASEMLKTFQERRDVLTKGINSIPLLSCNKPMATFYAMVNINETGMDSIAFSYKLLEKAHIAVVPGITYGKCCKHYIRIAFTLETDKIRKGIERIRHFMASNF